MIIEICVSYFPAFHTGLFTFNPFGVFYFYITPHKMRGLSIYFAFLL